MLAAPNLPPDGVGFVELTYDDGRPFPVVDPHLNQTVPTLRHRLAAESTPQQFQFSVRRTELVDISSLEAKSYFRGGWYPQPIWVRGPQRGIKIVYPKPAYHLPRITVEGDRTKPALIVFVLDCSGSMNDPVTGREARGKKIDLARNALLEILSDLLRYQKATHGSYRVGLVLYGHRSNWKNPDKLSDDPKDFFLRDTQQPIHPDNDVEALNDSLVDLSEEELKTITKRVNKLKPTGVTPLYAALIRAISLIRDSQVSDAASRHIIAITDGVNETPATPSGRYQVTSHEVLDLAADNPDVRIDIVGFDMDRMPGSLKNRLTMREYQDKIEELKQITKAFSLGSYFPASEPGKLVRQLREAIRPANVDITLERAEQPPVTSSFALGTTWTDQDWAGQTDQCQLEIQDPRSGGKSERTCRTRGRRTSAHGL